MVKISDFIAKKIRSIQFQTTHLAEDLLAGIYKSTFKGMGMEFEEVREYQQGDEIRTIDWNVTARMNRPYVKSFREEREITVTLAIDTSASTYFGSGKHIKSEYIIEIAALIAFSAIKNNDKVALLLFSDTIEKYIPPHKGTRHVLRVIREILVHKSIHKGTNIGTALSYLNKVQKRSGICFLISDFICPEFSQEAALIARKHDLISIAIADETEEIFPNLMLANITDLETEKSDLIDTSSPYVQEYLKQSFKERMLAQKKLMHKLGADFTLIQTNRPYFTQLKKFFILRQKSHR